ncbi:hypothetical protein B566_EDAN016710 [Ephemera danica]|nr:hypothetical protein B566_EDAN016710 [Ephemera danica]
MHKKMYTLSKGPSKFVAKARRGLTQKLERLDSRDHTRKPADSATVNANGGEDGQQVMNNSPKPVFHSVNKKVSSQRSQQEEITPQHEELIKYIYDSWSSVCKELEEETSSDKSQSSTGSIAYYESEDSTGVLQV